MKTLLISGILTLAVSGACAETVTTTDGRQIDLHEDGTYKILGAETNAISVTLDDPYFEYVEKEYGKKEMRFMPIFINDGQKTIVGLKFRTSFQSAFGDEVFAFDGESSEKISPKKPSSSEIFYYFEDNQFIGDEPFDKLRIFKSSGTGKIVTKVIAVIYEDGQIVKAE